jgi:hypothetical protein
MALGSLVDSPLPPLGIGGGLGGLTDEQRESFMKARGPEVAQPEVYTNPVTKEIIDGFTNSDFAKNVNQMQQDVATININGLPITGNGSYIGNLSQYIKSIGKGDMLSGALLQPGGALSGIPLDPQANMSDTLGPQLIDPGAEARRKADEEFLKTADEYQRGFRESEFYKPNAPMTTDVAEFLYKSPTGEDITMKGSSSKIGQFGSYLDSIGKGDLLQSVGGVMSAQTPGLQDLLTNTGEQTPPGFGPPPTPTIPDFQAIPKLDGTVGFPVTVSGDDSIASTATVNPYQEQFTGFGNQLTGFGNQLTGFGDQFSGLDKQFNTINTRLNSMDEGIAGLSELLQPQQKLYNSPYSNFNFRNNSYSNPSPFGLGSLFGRRY